MEYYTAHFQGLKLVNWQLLIEKHDPVSKISHLSYFASAKKSGTSFQLANSFWRKNSTKLILTNFVVPMLI
jgi:hypothetical protein